MSDKPLYHRSIRSKLLLMQSLMLGLLALVIGGLSLYMMTTYVEKFRVLELHSRAQAAALSTYHYTRYREETLITIAKSKAVEKYYKSSNVHAVNSYLSQFATIFPFVALKEIGNPDTLSFLNGELHSKIYKLNMASDAIHLKPNKIFIGDPVRSTILDAYVIRMGYLYVNYFGENIGPVFAEVKLNNFDAIMNKLLRNDNGHVFVVNSAGKIIFSNNHSWIAKSIKDMPGTDDLSRISETESSVVPYRISFEEHFVTVALIPELQWKVYYSVPMNIFSAPINTLRNSVLIASLTLISFGLLITYIIVNKITFPISRLASVIENVTETGELTRHVPFRSDDELGRLAGSFNTMLDKLKESHQKIDDERQFISGVISSMADSLIILKDDGTIIKINAAAINLLAYDEVKLKELSILEIIPEFNNILEQLQNDNSTSIVQDTIFKVSTGIEIPVILSLSTMLGGDIVLLVKDNTERKRIEKTKNEFIATVSHELRTPLTSIIGSLGLIEGGLAGTLPVELRRLLHIANNNASRLLLIVNDILDIQKIESGSMVFNYQRLKILHVLKKSVNENVSFMEQKEINIVISHEGVAESKVYADESRILQVMNNLLSNAIKFSPENEVVSIFASHEEGAIRVSVHNYGPGIPESFQSRVFDRFSQADSTDSRKNGGAGLGLSISKMILKQHRGSIGFTTDEKSGTTFYFDLPVI